MGSIFDIINIPLGFIIRVAYNLTNNYAVALLLFSIVMQLVLLPIAVKQQKTQIKQAKLAPKVAALRKKYAGRDDKVTKQKLQEETMALYQKEGFNPAGGCLPMLIQFPIIIALYSVVQYPLRYICQMGNDVVEAIKNAMVSLGFNYSGAYSQISMTRDIKSLTEAQLSSTMVDINGTSQSLASVIGGIKLPDFSLFGLDLSEIPTLSWPPKAILILPVVMLALLYFTQIITKRFTYRDPQTEETQNALSMKIMTWAMPLLSFYISFRLSAAICLYWIYRNVLQLVQTIALAKAMPLPKYSAEDYKNAEKEFMTSSARKKEKKNEGKVRSLHHIDDDDYEETTKPQPRAEATKKSVIESAPLKDDSSSDTKDNND